MQVPVAAAHRCSVCLGSTALAAVASVCWTSVVCLSAVFPPCQPTIPLGPSTHSCLEMRCLGQTPPPHASAALHHVPSGRCQGHGASPALTSPSPFVNVHQVPAPLGLSPILAPFLSVHSIPLCCQGHGRCGLPECKPLGTWCYHPGNPNPEARCSPSVLPTCPVSSLLLFSAYSFPPLILLLGLCI